MNLPRKFALIGPTENVTNLIAVLDSNGRTCVDHFPSLKDVENDSPAPLGRYDVVILDAAISAHPVKKTFFDNLETIFGECAFVVLGGERSLSEASDLAHVKVVENDASIAEILKAANLAALKRLTSDPLTTNLRKEG